MHPDTENTHLHDTFCSLWCVCITCEGVWRHIEHSGWEVAQTIESDVEFPQVMEVTNPCRELPQSG